MTIDDVKLQIVRTLIGLYPNSDKLGKGSEVGYHLALEDMPVEVFTREVWRAVMDAHPSFPPNPGELRAFVKAATQPPAMTADEAWHHAMWAMRRSGWGRDRAPDFPSEAVALAVRDAGGVTAIGQADTERELPFLRRRFDAAYQEHARRAATEPTRTAALEALAAPTRPELGRGAA